MVVIHRDAPKFEIVVRSAEGLVRDVEWLLSSLAPNAPARLAALDRLRDGASKCAANQANSPIIDYLDKRRREIAEG